MSEYAYAASSQINPHNGLMCGLIRFGGEIPSGSFEVFIGNPDYNVNTDPIEKLGTWTRYDKYYRDEHGTIKSFGSPQRSFGVADPPGMFPSSVPIGTKLSDKLKADGIQALRESRTNIGKIDTAINLAFYYLQKLGL